VTSTTVAAAAFRLEHVSTSGEVTYADHTLTHADERSLTRYRRDHVGFVFQFYNLIPSLTARENVALVTDIVNHPLPPDEALALVGLQSRADHFPSQLSGGEQQRVAIPRAIVVRGGHHARYSSHPCCDSPGRRQQRVCRGRVADRSDTAAVHLCDVGDPGNDRGGRRIW